MRKSALLLGIFCAIMLGSQAFAAPSPIVTLLSAELVSLNFSPGRLPATAEAQEQLVQKLHITALSLADAETSLTRDIQADEITLHTLRGTGATRDIIDRFSQSQAQKIDDLHQIRALEALNARQREELTIALRR